MPADDIRLGRRNRFLDLRNDWVDWLQCRLAFLLLTYIGDLKPISLNQWFPSQVGINYRSDYRFFVGGLSGRYFGHIAGGHRAEHAQTCSRKPNCPDHLRPPMFRNNVRFDSGGYAAEFILIVAIPRKSAQQSPMLRPLQGKQLWNLSEREARRLPAIYNN